ncbi:hypothetical protein HK099_000999, partial [Clydaea vesicula]
LMGTLSQIKTLIKTLNNKEKVKYNQKLQFICAAVQALEKTGFQNSFSPEATPFQKDLKIEKEFFELFNKEPDFVNKFCLDEHEVNTTFNSMKNLLLRKITGFMVLIISLFGEKLNLNFKLKGKLNNLILDTVFGQKHVQLDFKAAPLKNSPSSFPPVSSGWEDMDVDNFNDESNPMVQDGWDVDLGFDFEDELDTKPYGILDPIKTDAPAAEGWDLESNFEFSPSTLEEINFEVKIEDSLTESKIGSPFDDEKNPQTLKNDFENEVNVNSSHFNASNSFINFEDKVDKNITSVKKNVEVILSSQLPTSIATINMQVELENTENTGWDLGSEFGSFSPTTTDFKVTENLDVGLESLNVPGNFHNEEPFEHKKELGWDVESDIEPISPIKENLVEDDTIHIENNSSIVGGPVFSVPSIGKTDYLSSELWKPLKEVEDFDREKDIENVKLQNQLNSVTTDRPEIYDISWNKQPADGLEFSPHHFKQNNDLITGPMESDASNIAENSNLKQVSISPQNESTVVGLEYSPTNVLELPYFGNTADNANVAQSDVTKSVLTIETESEKNNENNLSISPKNENIIKEELTPAFSDFSKTGKKLELIANEMSPSNNEITDSEPSDFKTTPTSIHSANLLMNVLPTAIEETGWSFEENSLLSLNIENPNTTENTKIIESDIYKQSTPDDATPTEAITSNIIPVNHNLDLAEENFKREDEIAYNPKTIEPRNTEPTGWDFESGDEAFFTEHIQPDIITHYGEKISVDSNEQTEDISSNLILTVNQSNWNFEDNFFTNTNTEANLKNPAKKVDKILANNPSIPVSDKKSQHIFFEDNFDGKLESGNKLSSSNPKAISEDSNLIDIPDLPNSIQSPFSTEFQGGGTISSKNKKNSLLSKKDVNQLETSIPTEDREFFFKTENFSEDCEERKQLKLQLEFFFDKISEFKNKRSSLLKFSDVLGGNVNYDSGTSLYSYNNLMLQVFKEVITESNDIAAKDVFYRVPPKKKKDTFGVNVFNRLLSVEPLHPSQFQTILFFVVGGGLKFSELKLMNDFLNLKEENLHLYDNVERQKSNIMFGS